jgi:two-component system nitrogen regulation sensor histidine kinase NtrY
MRTLLVRIAAESVGNDIRGFVVTFDDVSELLSAQRKAAWADVARRIAHEIKNPLTPIQLSAERLRRKYLKEITSDPETFQMCTDTIVRQVDDIGRMVDEFSAFARMPSPVMKPQNINDLCRQAVFLQSSAHAGIKFSADLPPGPLTVPCDGRQISQALTNLLQNAVDSIEGRPAPDIGELPPGEVRLAVQVQEDRVTIIIADNGKGLPQEERDRLTEPYVTTRTKGTGLGLAIVKKIMEDHGGELVLEDRPEGVGAQVRLVIPKTEIPAPAVAVEEAQQKQSRYGA